jgi:hypothetical protein
MTNPFGEFRVFGDFRKEEDKVEHALVMVHDDKHATLVHGVGIAIEMDLYEAGLGRDEAGPLAHAPDEIGLWVWEGIPTFHPSGSWEQPYESYEPEYGGGTWRRPTIAELGLLTNDNIKLLFGPSRWPPDPATEEEKP